MALVGMVCASTVAAEPAASSEAAPIEQATVDAAVERALLYLARNQGADGSLAGGTPAAANDSRLAITGLATLAFLSCGHTPGEGRFGVVVSNAEAYLLSAAAATPEGYVGSVDGSRMYGQGIVALALSQLLGAEHDAERRAKLLAAVNRSVSVILKAQAVEKPAEQKGGWRYEPSSGDSDLSLTGWNVLALHGAKLAGIEVPVEAFRGATGFVLSCRAASGGFAYQPKEEARPASTGAGVVTLMVSAGWPSALASGAAGANTPDAAPPDALAALDFLLSRPLKFDEKFPYYSAHYTLHASHLAGRSYYRRAAEAIVPVLLSRQKPDGSFEASPDGQEPGAYYATALTALTLSLPKSELPAYQPALGLEP